MLSEGILCKWSLSKLSPSDIEQATQKHIDKFRKLYDNVGSLKPEEVNFESCIKALIDIEGLESTEENPLDFAQHSATEKPIRDASTAAAQKLNDFSVEITMRKDIFDNICLFKEKFGLDGLTAEQKRYVEKEIIIGKRNGLHLPEDQRKTIMEVKKKISELGTKFTSNMNEDNTFLEFTEEELVGVPDDLIKTFEKTDSGKLKVTMKYPHFFPVTKKCSNPETRRKMETAYQSKCMEINTPILEELIRLRQKQAELLGYQNHAAYVQELRMAKTPETVEKFLSELAVKLQPLWKEERAEMLEIKKKECEELGHKFSGDLDFWDFRYYMTKVEEQKYSVDQEKLKQYFPMKKVTEGLFEIYQHLLGLVFVEVENPEAWADGVQLFRVDDAKTKEKLGYFFLDLFPREGKYGHYAIFDLQPSCINSKGERQVGVCAMMCNFPKPTADKPSLLEHGEVETYFHEFGHVMHMLCSRTDTARFRGTHVERDFVEAPSQMLENWVWEEEALKKMSGHYKDNSSIPRELLDKLIASRKANAGGFNLRQIILASFDQFIHSVKNEEEAKLKTAEKYTEIYNKIMGIKPIPNTNMPASWTHMIGYDAQYYGYLWSEVFSYDMYETRFLKEGLLNPSVGADYRGKILQPGGTKDAMDLLRDFLGREPNQNAFLKAKGLNQN